MNIEPFLFGVMLFILGVCIGSFLNVVIYRLPRDESIVRPRSHCPKCSQPIPWYDNIPLLSFFILHGRCRSCKERISLRYPVVEFLTGVFALALFWKFGFSKTFFVHFAFTGALVAITFIDITHRIIPNEISLPGIAIGFVCSFLYTDFWKESLIGIIVGSGGLFLISMIYAFVRGREGMGMGDVKLLGMLGAWLGFRSLLFILLFASVQAVIVSVGVVAAGGKLKPPLPEEGEEVPDKQQTDEHVSFLSAAIPFGPFLALSAVEYVFFSQRFFNWLFAISS